MDQLIKKTNGFTLVELMVTMAIASLVMVGIYSAYSTQQKSHTVQQQVGEMQQNIRSAIYMLEREARMAGYDPWPVDGVDNNNDGTIDEAAEDTADAGIKVAMAHEFEFTADLDEDGAISANGGDSEWINLKLSASEDTNNDGIADDGAAAVIRTSGEGTDAVSVKIAEDIHCINFAYAFDADNDGQLDVSPAGNVIWAQDTDGDGSLDWVLDNTDDGEINSSDTGADMVSSGFTTAVVPVADIRAVRVWLLARTRFPVKGHTERDTYIVGSRSFSPNDSYDRRLLTTMVRFRNLL